MRTAIGLLKLIALGEEDILSDRTRDQDEVFADLEAALQRRMKTGEVRRNLEDVLLDRLMRE